MLENLKKLGRDRGGFTLTEVLVGILVLVTAIVASSNLLVSMIHSNAANMSTLQAYYYTQEGLEAFRNMRDTHFLNNVDFCGGGMSFWGISNGFSDGCSGDGRNYVIDVKKEIYGFDFSSVAPWKLSPGDNGSVKFLNGEENIAEDTGFTRFCAVSDYPVDAGKAFKVTCTTSWEQNSSQRSVSISAILTDWKDE